MNTRPEIHCDIETIPAQNTEIIASIRESLSVDFKAPSDMTKERACAELGMTDPNEIKFTSKARALEMWVERFRDEKLDETVEAEYRKTSFNGALGQIAVFGLAVDDREPQMFYSPNWQDPDAEHRVVAEAFEFIADTFRPESMRSPIFIGHYISGFDLRFIFQRAVILGIKPPSFIPFHARPWDDGIFDTMTQWAGHNGTIKLDALCRALGVPGKTEGMDGSQVWDYVRSGRIAEVAAYCADDIDASRNCYKRMTFQPLPVPMCEQIPEGEFAF
ncbi:3'-5' exonuclease family protein [Burkholderia vietnamiensis]|uniref:ribonuclease H-like domain-containing protein n=1 Tax=Burkholderia vietnamiensis TaxID=60552 RepID=UPI001CF2F5EF|nr:ribonuclease H-like domain-containing protein [Burkholderia vietnamiensis]MCA8266468.1 ribonuclease H-like domain-containing protein [Burkholderia vietnamiensis]